MNQKLCMCLSSVSESGNLYVFMFHNYSQGIRKYVCVNVPLVIPKICMCLSSKTFLSELGNICISVPLVNHEICMCLCSKYILSEPRNMYVLMFH